MLNRPIADLLTSANQHAHALEHRYLGAEHLMLALLDPTPHTPLREALHQQGIDAQVVIQEVIHYSTPASQEILWQGIPQTARTSVLIDIAYEIALAEGRQEQANEFDVLYAFLEEAESLPYLILMRHGFSQAQLITDTTNP